MAGPGGPQSSAEVSLAQALEARAVALCAIPSPIGKEQAICDQVETWARARFESVRRIQNSLVVFADGESAGGDRPLVALCGHLDTVPVHEADRGKAPVCTGGKLVATGASDMKGGLTVMMELGERLAPADRFCNLALVFYSREEGPYLENELAAVLRDEPRLRRVSLALCLEPTDNTLQLGCAGSILATMTFQGRSAHAARPWQGVNAIHRAGQLLTELEGCLPREVTSGGLIYREVISATRIEGGWANNVVPDRCTLVVNFRFAPDKTPEVAAEELRQLGERAGAVVTITDLAPACPAFADHPLVERLRQRTKARIEPKQAWTDVARLAQVGVPAVNLGPGATLQAHQQGEWIELASLEQSYRMLEAFLRR